MKKRLIIFFVLILIVAGGVFLWFKFYKKKIITFETVKIISYKLTKNGHVISESLASGTIISKDGLVLTNHHVVTDENEESYEIFAICLVESEKEKPFCTNTASLIAKNESLDIALLKINEKDIFGKDLKSFDFLDYEGKKIGIDEKVNVIGFPAIGGKTITSTQGQISGYEEKEGTKFLKIDAKIDQGNSGGTVKDEKGNFVGIPSFLKSNYDTLGYIIPLDAVQNFIKENEKKDAGKNEMAIKLLNEHLQKKYDLEKNKIYRSSFFPYFEMNITDSWEVEKIDNEGFSISQTIDGKDFSFDLTMGRGGDIIPVDDFLKLSLEKIEKQKHLLQNYQREDKEFKGFKGYQIGLEEDGDKVVSFYGIKENVTFTYTYVYSNEIKDKAEKEAEILLNSFKDLNKPNDTELNKKVGKSEFPKAEMETFNDFHISYVDGGFGKEKDLLFVIDSNKFLEMKFEVYDSFIKKDFWNMSEEEVFEKYLQSMPKSFTISDKYKEIQINGMKGFGFTFSYILDDIKKPHKSTSIFLYKNKKEMIFIVYDDLAENYDKNLETFIKTIQTFKYEDRNGETILPQFKNKYNDLKNYVYETEISSLVNHGIIDLEGESFFPEKDILAKEVLFAVLKSKVFIEKGRNSTETLKAIEKEGFFGYAENRKIIDKSFEKNSPISLNEALKIMCEVYELPVWKPPYKTEESLPYFYKWKSMKYPISVNQNKNLTRGEFASVLYYFMQSAGERKNF